MEEKELEQFEFCVETDCYFNDSCVCVCDKPQRDARYGRGCPCYSPD